MDIDSDMAVPEDSGSFNGICRAPLKGLGG